MGRTLLGEACRRRGSSSCELRAAQRAGSAAAWHCGGRLGRRSHCRSSSQQGGLGLRPVPTTFLQTPPLGFCAASQPEPAPSPPPLTVTDVVVGVADAEVAPAVLHAVAPVGALRVHVAGRGRDFCRDRRKSRLRRSRGPRVVDKGWAAQDPVPSPGRPGSGTSEAGPLPGWGWGSRDHCGGPVPGGPSPAHHLNSGWGMLRGRARKPLLPRATLALVAYRIRRGTQRSPGGTGRGWCWLPGICHRCDTHSRPWGFLPRREGTASNGGAGGRGLSCLCPASGDFPYKLLCAAPHSHTFCPGCLHAHPSAFRHAHPTGGPSPAARTLPAVQAHEAFWALAHVALICVHTGSPVLARGRQTGVRHWVASCKKDSGHQRSQHTSGFQTVSAKWSSSLRPISWKLTPCCPSPAEPPVWRRMRRKGEKGSTKAEGLQAFLIKHLCG